MSRQILRSMLALFMTSSGFIGNAGTPKKVPNTDQKHFTISGTIWSKNGEKVWVHRKNKIEFTLNRSKKSTKYEAIGPFIKGESSILALEYNLDVEHGKPFILNFESWISKTLESTGILFDAGVTNDHSIYWALEGVDAGKIIESYLLLYSNSGQQLIRQKVINPGVNIVFYNGVKFEINVRLARGVDLIN